MHIIVYPDEQWNIFKFPVKPMRFWNDKSNQRLFLDYFAKEHNITSIDDWYQVTRDDIMSLGGRGLLSKYQSFYKCLQEGRKIYFKFEQFD